MNLATKIICRTIGAVGAGTVLYNAGKSAAHYSRVNGQKKDAEHIENAYFDSRTTDTYSPISAKIGEEVFEHRSKNPLPSIWGRITGGIGGFVRSLADNVIPLTCACFALVGKDLPAKIASVGIVLSLGYDILRNGFGMGKNHPMK